MKNNLSIKIIFYSVLLLIFFAGANTSFAKIYPEDITPTIIPSSPKPGDSVTISINTYSTDLNKDKIIWTVNGKVVKSGIAEKSITTTMGAIGKTTTININITDPDGQFVDKIISLSPTQIDLLYQADSSVPPFYQGKALYPHQGQLKITAMPVFIDSYGVKINPSNLIYKWRKDDVVLGSLSGYGKQTLNLQGSAISNSITINVEVMSVDGSISGSQEITITPTQPNILFYKNSPLYGVMYENALAGTYKLDSAEVSISAVPFYYNNQNINSLNYSWAVNSNAVDGQTNTKTFRPVGDIEGSSQVSVRVENPIKFLQYATKDLMINFNSSAH